MRGLSTPLAFCLEGCSILEHSYLPDSSEKAMGLPWMLGLAANSKSGLVEKADSTAIGNHAALETITDCLVYVSS